jgi:hypothetical protein
MPPAAAMWQSRKQTGEEEQRSQAGNGINKLTEPCARATYVVMIVQEMTDLADILSTLGLT